jgi:hypothetical protein
MVHDRKKKGSDTEPFGSIDNADFHLMLNLVQKHPNFVQKHLSALPQELQFYFKKAYNALGRRDLDKDLSGTKGGSYWGNQVKDLVGNFGDNIKKKLAAVKTRNSPSQPAPEVPAPQQGSLGAEDDFDAPRTQISGRLPIEDMPTRQPALPPRQARLPFWR